MFEEFFLAEQTRLRCVEEVYIIFFVNLSSKWISKNVNITCLPACLIFFLALALVLIQSACCS